MSDGPALSTRIGMSVLLRGGWCGVGCVDLPDNPINVRFELAGERLVVGELHIGGGVTSEVLRAIPLGQIEVMANGDIGRTIRRRIEEATESDLEPPPLPPVAMVWRKKRAQQEVMETPSLRVDVPPRGHNYGDAFYRSVAEIWTTASLRSRSPAKEIAAENGVTVTAVHGWVKEARRRKLLAPGRKRQKTD